MLHDENIGIRLIDKALEHMVRAYHERQNKLVPFEGIPPELGHLMDAIEHLHTAKGMVLADHPEDWQKDQGLLPF